MFQNMCLKSWVVLLAGVCAAWVAAAQEPSPPGGAAPTQDQMIGRMLTNLRANPQAKPVVLERWQGRMAIDGFADAGNRLTELGWILDEAIAMTPAKFEANRQQIIARIVAQLTGGTPGSLANAIPWIDVHVHFIGAGTPMGLRGAARAAANGMANTGRQMMIVMAAPGNGRARQAMTADYDCEKLKEAVREFPARFAFLGGGLETIPDVPVTSDMKRRFEQRAEAMLRLGARGFGEMALHHTAYPYQSVPGDHPLMLLLADVAARHDALLDIHMDLVAGDMPSPSWLAADYEEYRRHMPPLPGAPAQVPSRLSANLPAFERLLDHNSHARVLWEHCGTDVFGHWTAGLSHHLLEKHPNLYMAMRIALVPGRFPETNPMTPERQIKPDWLKLFQDFPTRFVIGTDSFIAPPDMKSGGWAFDMSKTAFTPRAGYPTQAFLHALPPDLARKIASENAIRVFKLKD